MNTGRSVDEVGTCEQNGVDRLRLNGAARNCLNRKKQIVGHVTLLTVLPRPELVAAQLRNRGRSHPVPALVADFHACPLVGVEILVSGEGGDDHGTGLRFVRNVAAENDLVI